MTAPILLCMLPAERVALVPRILAAGAVPVIDATVSTGITVPEGAWVRARSRRSVPGKGPVLLAGNHKAPVRNRPTWLEVTEKIPIPDGFAGVVVRGSEVGGACGARSSQDLLADLPRSLPVVVALEEGPAQAGRAVEMGACGVALSSVLLALPALELPPRLRTRLERSDRSTSHVVNGFRIEASPLAPVLRRLLAGASFWEQAEGYFESDDPSDRAWPMGEGLRVAQQLASEHGDLEGLVGAYLEALSGATVGAPVAGSPAVSPAPVSTRSGVERRIAVIGMGCRMPGANSLEVFWQNIEEGKSSIVEVPEDRWKPTLYWDEDRTAPDKTYSKIGGFITSFQFQSRRFRIPPKVAGL
ncbi:MAG: beta-ketoacyl synthase N-terminal-like domain-containing protein, partial [Myxococcota bacterium]|nr:beta-ketoacyl synthase N-terminal-like domain-containing protein [Myxococcota bacterium]